MALNSYFDFAENDFQYFAYTQSEQTDEISKRKYGYCSHTTIPRGVLA